ncbi:MAG TPA: hypothetical protein VJY54_03015 [Lachnospiraceae bacterium]|nr:hypothetical protein [Lachnospiraceae bacterium]
MENRPEWMNDSLVKDMDEKKLQFLSELVLGGKGKSQKEVMPYMMLKLKQAKSDNLTFSSSDITAVIAAIKNHSTPEEMEQINNIMKKASKK